MRKMSCKGEMFYFEISVKLTKRRIIFLPVFVL